VNARTNPIAATGLERLESFEAIVARLRAEQARRASNFTPFPDPEGEDRDERRVIEWDFTR
jgi:hypothetical protein